MDSKTKAVAARISLSDYNKIVIDTARLGIKINDWLICKMYGYPLIKQNTAAKESLLNEDFLSFPDQKNEQIRQLKEEINKLELSNKHFIRRIHQLESINSTYSSRIDKLEYLLKGYNKNWEDEYDALYGY